MAAPTSYFDANTPDVVLKSLFMKYDKDNSGVLTRSELSSLLESDLGMTTEEASSHALLMDKDGSGKTSFQELKDWLHHSKALVQDSSKYYYLQKAVEYFKQCDTDGSGALDEAEIAKLLQSVGCKADTIQSASKALDKDGNGKVSFNEFLKWLNWIPTEGL